MLRHKTPICVKFCSLLTKLRDSQDFKNISDLVNQAKHRGGPRATLAIQPSEDKAYEIRFSSFYRETFRPAIGLDEIVSPAFQVANETVVDVGIALNDILSEGSGEKMVVMTEDQLEQETLGWLTEVGYDTLYGPDIAHDGSAPERPDYLQVLLPFRLREAIHRLNPNIPTAAKEDALKQVLDLGIPALLSANRQFHKLLVGGVPVQYQKDGETRGDFVRLIDWANPAKNSGWRSTSSRSRGRTTLGGPTSSCSSTACRWC